MSLSVEERLAICKTCSKRKFSRDHGIICSLVNDHGRFTESCPDYDVDEKAVIYERERAARKESIKNENNLDFSLIGIKDTTTAGIVGIVIAMFWFFIGLLALDIIFFYPVVLFFVGMVTVVNGEKKKKEEKILPKDVEGTLDGDELFDT